MVKSYKERLQEITESIEQGIKDLFASDRYEEYLRTMSRFHNYSANNVMLIHMQMPNATYVAGFNKWRDRFGRSVKRGERGIQIIAPVPYKKTIQEIQKDPYTQAPLLDGDGKAIVKEREVEVPVFRVTSVFDISQTEGRPLPQLAQSLKGNVEHYDIFLEALRRSAPVPVGFEAMAGSMDGYFDSRNQKIAIREGMSEIQTVSALIHEIAHSRLHNPKIDNPEAQWKVVMVGADGTKQEYIGGFASEEEAVNLAQSADWRFVDENRTEWKLEVETDDSPMMQAERTRQTEEIEAESISYAVCQYYGIETGENSFGYIASWSSDKDLKELKSCLETISKTSGRLIRDVDYNFVKLCKERGIVMDKEPKKVFKLETNPWSKSKDTRFLIQQYQEMQNDELEVGPVLFIGPAEKCQEILKDLQSGDLLPEQARDMMKSLAEGDKEKPEQINKVSYYVAECMEFPGQGEHYENLTLQEAVAAYKEIPQDRMNGVKGIGIQVEGDGIYNGVTFPVVDGGRIDLDTMYGIEVFRNSPLVHEAVEGLIAAVPEAEVIPYAGELPQGQSGPAQELDAYPVPDKGMGMQDLEQAGYLDGDMLPVAKERVAELLDKDFSVYGIVDGGQAELMLDMGDVDALPMDAIFAVSKEEWESSKEFDSMVQDRLQHQEEREAAFLSHDGDCFAIYQVKDNGDTHGLRFSSLEQLQASGQTVKRENYDLVYTAPLSEYVCTDAALNDLWEKFNNEHPADYHSPSMSVSDIIAIKRDGKVSCHYCDRFGHAEIQDFLAQGTEKAAELSKGNDDGGKEPTIAQLRRQVRSGDPITVMKFVDAVQKEGAQKQSVMEQLKSQPKQEYRKTEKNRNMERGI